MAEINWIKANLRGRLGADSWLIVERHPLRENLHTAWKPENTESSSSQKCLCEHSPYRKVNQLQYIKAIHIFETSKNVHYKNYENRSHQKYRYSTAYCLTHGICYQSSFVGQHIIMIANQLVFLGL
jgi:hypothetical protein